MSESLNTILVPVGFSEQSMIALTQATHFAKVTKAEITLLTVISGNSSLKKALKEAISKVNGVSLKTESVLETIDNGKPIQKKTPSYCKNWSSHY